MMKKWIALLLALVVLSSMAVFAAAEPRDDSNGILYGVDLEPGEEYIIQATIYKGLTSTEGKKYKTPIDRSTFKVGDVDWTEGGGMVDYVKITDDGLVMRIKPKYSGESRDLVGTITLVSRVDTVNSGLSKDEEFVVDVDCSVTYDEKTVYRDDRFDPDYDEAYQPEEGGWMTFGNRMDSIVKAYLERDTTYYLYCESSEIIQTVESKYPAAAGQAKYLQYKGRPKFTEDATVMLMQAKQGYAYQFASGQLSAIPGATWTKDGSDTGWSFKTRQLGAYVLSDVPLLGESGTGISQQAPAASSQAAAASAPATDAASAAASKNPDTGASPAVAVGVLGALAVVALAGAAVLRKQ